MGKDRAGGRGPDQGEELLGPEEVARRMGVAKVTIWRWCREGRLPCIKAGKGWRVRRSALGSSYPFTEGTSKFENEPKCCAPPGAAPLMPDALGWLGGLAWVLKSGSQPPNTHFHINLVPV